MLPSRLIAKEEIAERTLMITFARPKGFAFRAGQHIDLYLPNLSPVDSLGHSRTLSLTSAPHEEHLSTIIRLRRTAFKEGLAAAAIGEEFGVDGPFGSFALPKDASRPVVMIAGGVGVAPMRSMIRDAALRGLPCSLTLFYSNRRPQDAPFLSEFAELEAHCPRFKMIATMTESSFFKWDGERGRISADLIRKHVSVPAAAFYYIAGSFRMTLALRELLHAMDVDDDLIRTEEFAGY